MSPTMWVAIAFTIVIGVGGSLFAVYYWEFRGTRDVSETDGPQNGPQNGPQTQ